MWRLLILSALTAAIASAADDPWAKVKELKSGTEIRIYKRGASAPLEGKIDEVRDDALAVVLKNTQESISRDEIDRLDYRPPAPKSPKVTSTSKTSTEDPNAKPPAGMSRGPAVPGASSSTSVNIGGSKPAYETIYRRVPPAPQKQ